MMTHLVTRTKLARLVPFTRLLKTAAAKCDERRRVELPKELSQDVIVLSCDSSTAKGGVCDIYVVGTNHFSKESSKQVEDIIKYLKPEVVFLELCSSRQHILIDEKMEVPTVEDMIGLWKEKHNILLILYVWSMAKNANKIDVYPGAEFRSGYREARKYGGIVVLGDRPQQITLKRTWRKLPLKHIIRLLNPSYYLDINFSDSLSISDQIKEKMWELLPTVMETIIHERDQYMSYALLNVASETGSIVAVVGRRHLEGIKKNWEQPIKIEDFETQMEDLETIPPPKLPIPVMKIFAYVGIVIAGVTIITKTYL